MGRSHGGDGRRDSQTFFFWDDLRKPQSLEGGYFFWGGSFFWSDQNYQELREKNLFGPAPHFLAFMRPEALGLFCPAAGLHFFSTIGGSRLTQKKLSIFFSGSHPQKKTWLFNPHFVHRTGPGLPQMVLVFSFRHPQPRAPTSNCSPPSRRCRFFALSPGPSSVSSPSKKGLLGHKRSPNFFQSSSVSGLPSLARLLSGVL